MVILGLGSNQGDRQNSLRKAIQRLKSTVSSPEIEVLAVSPIYESDALLPEGAPPGWNQPFLNVNVLCRTSLPPLELLKHVKSIEEFTGRRDRGRWAPREIDIDILAMDSLVFESETLKVPHPSLISRPFALLPFADLMPDWKFPQPGLFFDKTALELVSPWKRTPPDQIPFHTRRSHLCMTELVGILNITPDSFSDGGRFDKLETAVEQARQMLSQGVRVLDIGAESTRPGATPLDPLEEWKRLEPVLRALRSEFATSTPPLILSVDTRHSEVAARAILAGANWINDVTGLSDPAMQKVVVDSSVDLVMMHSLTVPAQKNILLAAESDPVQLLLEWGEKRIRELLQLGITRERIIFDPGLGFGKTQEQSWEILREIRRFQELGVRILVGHSRKSFLSSLTPLPSALRDIETITLSLDLVGKGIDFLRVHEVEVNARALKAWVHVHGISQCQN